MKTGLVHKAEYADDKGFLVRIVNAPKGAATKADTIELVVVKEGGSYSAFYTPDEAMTVAIGLLKAVDGHLGDFYKDYRKKMDLLTV